MSGEPQSAADIKYINVKMKKSLKNNFGIIYAIKDAGELFAKMLLFLSCCENPEKIEFEFIKNNIKSKIAEDEEILKALDFWKEKNVLDYEITSVPNAKGINIENVVNIMLDVRRDINILNGVEETEATDYRLGLGIYEEKSGPKPEKKTEPEAIIKTAIEKEKTAIKSEPVSVDQVCESLETKEEFKRLIHEIQNKMRVILNTADYVIMYNIHETNKMEVDLILKLAEICAEEGKNNIRYLEKVALEMASDGILKMGQFEEKIKEMQKIKKFEERIKKLFNAETKKLTSKEKNYIKKWAKEYDFPDDVLFEGYNQCLKYTEKLSFDYINTIYSNWSEKGFKTLEEIKSEFGAASGLKMPEKTKNPDYNLERFFEKFGKNFDAR